MPDPDDLVRGAAVSLRAPRAADVPRWHAMLGDPACRQFGMPAFVEVPTEQALHERIPESRQRFADLRPGVLVVVGTTDPDRLLGIVSWRFDVAAPMRIADVGYIVHPDARGRGIATAALALLVRWLTVDADGPALARVQLDHSVENAESCRVALGAGVLREGVRRGFLPLRDPGAHDGVRRHDVCLHGVLGT